MPLAEEIRNERRVAEIFDLAVQGLVTGLGLSSYEGHRCLFIAAAKTMTPMAATQAPMKAHSTGDRMTDVALLIISALLIINSIATLLGF